MDMITRPLSPLSRKEARYWGPAKPRSETLPVGYRRKRGALALPCAILVERDFSLALRDGTTIYADIFRPAETSSAAGKVPAIVNWAPYGKGGTGYWDLDNSAMFPNRFGVRNSAVSGLQSWEGNDPAYWCAKGYAVAQVDPRGIFNSEGMAQFMSLGEAQDGADAIEALAALPWCNGKIGMAGNSWLAIAQWGIAAQRPAHLVAIAPWEGLTDPFRNSTMRGGVPNYSFTEFISDHLFGTGQIEDVVEMAQAAPGFNEHWASKIPDVASIQCPAYVVASYTNPIHSLGTLRGWAELRSPKWLRINNSHEWPDFYDMANVEDLRRFFDRYCKDQLNGWEDHTAPVRMSVLNPGHQDVVNRPERTFPPERATPRHFFLDARDKSLAAVPVETTAEARYKLSDQAPETTFTYRFDTTVELIGSPILSLYVSVIGHDEMDLFVYLEKLDRRGRQRWHQIVDLGLPWGRTWMPLAHKLGVKAVSGAFYRGADGVLRLSRRGLLATGPEKFPDTNVGAAQPIVEGVIVNAEIPFWPCAMRWHEGEQMRLKISARNLLPVLLPGLPKPAMQPGKAHVIHTGGDYPSRLMVPMCDVG